MFYRSIASPPSLTKIGPHLLQYYNCIISTLVLYYINVLPLHRIASITKIAPAQSHYNYIILSRVGGRGARTPDEGGRGHRGRNNINNIYNNIYDIIIIVLFYYY